VPWCGGDGTLTLDHRRFLLVLVVLGGGFATALSWGLRLCNTKEALRVTERQL
jgi:hypothetical protein